MPNHNPDRVEIEAPNKTSFVVVRLEGHNFRKLCNLRQAPLDHDFKACLWDTARGLCAEVPGACFAYVQAHEIFLVINKTLMVQAEFDFNNQELCSLVAPIAAELFAAPYYAKSPMMMSQPIKFDAKASDVGGDDLVKLMASYQKEAEMSYMPLHLQGYCGKKEVVGKKRAEILDLMFSKGINWSKLPAAERHGVCVVPQDVMVKGVLQKKWIVDEDIPVFDTTQGASYLKKHLS